MYILSVVFCVICCYITHLCRIGFYINPLDRSVSSRRGVWLILLLPCLLEIPVYVDPDQTPRFASSGLGLHCLPMSFKGTAGLNELNTSVEHLSVYACKMM